ncbi:MAG: 30S ribosomal protein S16 [Candidatus Lindowbacteria bacterium RIFCSPLOWO2_12_FULL_62_27]|nr:MAG: 30S ribosomal protein S16 [Candidatus Lindowbacteria bacterium RIFCSPLOWO2_02_FULL_62_12]OGH62583.1 MAG: 30S ribosomal protein S16 [Candidatus Lindowbacteria bacterium RIFCSPLOWO2_12_FULL_62_27]
MAVTLRLRRMGKKKQPFYRIVATDHRMPTDGRFLEIVGTYDPLKKPAKVELKPDRIRSWIDKGAVLSDTVRSILRRHGFFKKV